MNILDPLFHGTKICLTPIDHEKDPEIVAHWSQDAEYLRMLNHDHVRPFSPAQVKKHYEKIEKQAEESNSLFYYCIRTIAREDQPERLIGFTRIYWIEWTHGSGAIQLSIGDPNDRRQGFGSEALALMLRYAFMELNLFRLSAQIPEYNIPGLALFTKAGFVEEIRRREALNRYGRRWDALSLGLLQSEWNPSRLVS